MDNAFHGLDRFGFARHVAASAAFAVSVVV
jgi:hypothetical protein